jgi:hypothetical protein
MASQTSSSSPRRGLSPPVGLIAALLFGLACSGEGQAVMAPGDGGVTDSASASHGDGPGAGAGGFGSGQGGTVGAGGQGAGSGGTSGPGAGGALMNGSGGAMMTGSGGASASAGCPVSPSQCTDGIDNDGDGKIDSDDPECSGACDNDEGTFATGIPGDNKDDLASCHQDCFFDGNSGADACEFDLRCDPARADATQCKTGTEPPGVHCEKYSVQSQACRDTCGRLTPNGCDCFGCCQVGSTGIAVRLSATCTAAAINDPSKCQRCTPNPTCLNTCDKCEICYGKSAPDPSCNNPTPGTTVGAGGSSGSGGTSGTGGTSGSGGAPGSGGSPAPCAAGVVYCGTDGSVCPTSTYCVTGCCIRIVE